MFNKKAQGISMNVIIIAAIALLVLVVLSVIFMGRSAQFSEQIAACESNGGKCGAICGDEDSGTESYPTPYSAWGKSCQDKYEGDKPTCCIKPG